MTAPESWGRYPRLPPRRQLVLRDRHASLPVDAPLLAYGNGRSYGDSCQNEGGTLLLTHALDRFIAFDDATGVLRCEAGVLLDDILALATPRGWLLPVVPGTRYVTVGGAIANDVHGKNHHRVGSFGCHVRRFELLRGDGTRLECSPEHHADLFAATIGGLGLTGLIVWAEIQLVRLSSSSLSVETIRFGTVADFFALSRESNPHFDYTVAWIDCMARGRQLGRGLFDRANFLDTSAAPRRSSHARLSVPFTPPFPLLGGMRLRLLNRLLYYRPRRRHRTSHYLPFFCPLDGIDHWNRLYGPRGFLQHQSVLPPEGAEPAIADMLGLIAARGEGSFLAVLKSFGDLPSRGMMSFPRPGTTLALDFPFRGEATLRLLSQLDDIVATAGGAVYPAKDARMSAAHFRRFFPAWQAFSRHVDPAFSSSFWRRVATEAACAAS